MPSRRRIRPVGMLIPPLLGQGRSHPRHQEAVGGADHQAALRGVHGYTPTTATTPASTASAKGKRIPLRAAASTPAGAAASRAAPASARTNTRRRAATASAITPPAI